MLNWLKSLFSSSPRALKIADLEAHLNAPGGGSLHGDAEFEAWQDGSWEFEAELEHPQGAPAGSLEVYIDGVRVAELVTRGDESEVKLYSGNHPLARVPELGSQVEIRAGGAVVVSGAFMQDR